MSDEKSTEEQTVRIDAIVGDEVLGYEGTAQPELSGQKAPRERAASGDDLEDRLADNRPEQVK
jgi:hypothetical protein